MMLDHRRDTPIIRHGRIATASVLAGLLSGAMAMAGCSAGAGDTGNPTAKATSKDLLAITSESATSALLKSEHEIPTDGSPLLLMDSTDLWSEGDLNPAYDEREAVVIAFDGVTATIGNGTGATVTDDAVTISEGGTYVLRGMTETVGVIVAAPEDAQVHLALDGVSIRRDASAGIYARSAGKVFLTVVDGTENDISSVGSFSKADDGVDGAIFTKCDLTINGAGRLSVSSETAHGIVCKDDLRLISSETTVKAAEHAVQAKDSIAIHGGSWALDGGKDGLHAKNDEDPTKGWVYMGDGVVSISAASDGIDSGAWLQVDGGSLSVHAADDALHAECDLVVNGGTIDIPTSREGIEGGTVTITDGEMRVVSTDDGINATGNPSNASGDSPQQAAPGQGLEAGGLPTSGLADRMADEQGQSGAPNDQGASRPAPPNGAEGEAHPSGTPGDRPSQGTPDGIMPPPGAPSDAQGNDMAPGGRPKEQPWQQGAPEPIGTDPVTDYANAGDTMVAEDKPLGGHGAMMDADSSAILTISGGKVMIDAQGDGLDCNGLLHITGGETYVYGPTDDGNSAVDYGTELRTDGGSLVAVGSSGMVERVSNASGQASMTVFLEGATNGDLVVSENGVEVVKCSPTRMYSAVLVSTPSLTTTGTYDLSAGDVAQTVQMNGIATIVGTGGMVDGFGGMGAPVGDFSRPEDLIGLNLRDKDRTDYTE